MVTGIGDEKHGLPYHLTSVTDKEVIKRFIHKLQHL